MSEFTKFSVVVVGKLNPAIHQPWWYVHLGALTETEASSVEEVVTSGAVARFVISDKLIIQCDPRRWLVESRIGSDRALEVASVVFDALEHTPVEAFGLNFWSEVQSLRQEGRPSPVGDYTAQTISYRRDTAETQYTAKLELNVDPTTVHLNCHHNVLDLGLSPESSFDLSNLVRSWYSKDALEAQRVVELLSKE